MDPQTTLDALLNAGVLVEVNGDALALGEPFRAARGEHLQAAEAMDDDALSTTLAEATGGLVRLPDDRQERVEMLATYLALSDLDAAESHEERLQLLPMLGEFGGPTARDGGAPDSFTAVGDAQLRALLRTTRRAVVYVWRDDCDPCDVMREELESVFPEPPDDVALLAVYGPDAPEAMDQLEVVGAPTTLFVHRGEVDVRLHGAQYTEAIQSELEVLRSLD